MSVKEKGRALILSAAFGLGVAGAGGIGSAQQGTLGNQPDDAGRLPFEQEEERLPDPARGETLFKECRRCHETQPGVVKIGPSLAGVVGRQPGSVPAFGYSQDMIDYGSSGAVWNEQTLDRFLTRPRGLINGTKMVFQGFRKPADREDLIAYLSTIRG